MQRFFHVDLCDLWRGTLNLRRLRVLIDHLPLDAAATRAMAGMQGPLALWPLRDALLGRLVDEVTLGRWQWESAHLAKHQQPRKQPPSVLPRRTTTTTHGDDNVIPLVSPHRLGEFIYEQEEEE